MLLGIRPSTAKNFGEPWDPKWFAAAIRRNEKTIENYLANRSLPRTTGRLEMALFGPDSSYLEDWRLGLQDALRRTRERLAEASSEDEESSEELTNSQTILRNLRENGPTIIGGIGIAQGVAHLIWLLTEVLSGNPENLWEKHWAYADFGFGIGGIVIGIGCVWHLRWARKSGICFCLAALFSAYLWFADESNSDAERLLWATNVLNVPVSLGVLCYFLFSWPVRDD